MQLVFMLLFFGGIFGGGYWYYTDTQETIENLRENNIRLAVAAEDNERALDTIEENFKVAQEQIIALQERAKKAEEYQDQLISKLRRHDLTALTMQKPGLIEKRVNNATAKIFNDLEADTGAVTDK
jgi:soluble P-type ATPase